MSNHRYGIVDTSVRRKNGPCHFFDKPLYRHVETSVRFCRNIGTLLSKHWCVEILVRRNNGTAPDVDYGGENKLQKINAPPQYHEF